MAREDSDELPMLSAPGLLGSFELELSEMSLSSARPPDNSYFSGPLRPDNRYFSGPLRSNGTKPDERYFSGPIKNDISDTGVKLSSIPSSSNLVRRRPQPHTHDGAHMHLLRSGPLGKCNDPFCTSCPLYFENKQSGHGAPYLTPQKIQTSFLGKAKNCFSNAHMWSMACIPGVMNPHTKRVQQWNKLFIISCFLAIFVDPLFFFILSVSLDYKCIYFNDTFAKVITVLRSSTDMVYFIHMLIQFRLAYVNPSSEVGSGALVDNPKDIFWHYLSGWFLIDLFVVFPLPQILIWVVVPRAVGKNNSANFTKNLLRVTVLLQYVPRMIRFVPLLAGNASTGLIFETAWANFFLNLFLFLLVAHVVGSCWYLFGLQRVNQCLHDACVNATAAQCDLRFLDCGEGANITITMNQINANLWNAWSNNSNASGCLNTSSLVFVYGIYTFAVPVTLEKTFVSKYVYSLFWGFQQISTLAGNLVPSLFFGEVIFVLGIIALGLLLTVLLIGNMQNFLLSLSRRRSEMQWRRHDVELWMARRQLPLMFRKKVRQAERFKWSANKGVNEEELLKSLPEDIEKEIRKALCLDLIKRVQLFTVMEDQVLDAICQRLRQRLYIEGSRILRMNHPIDKMHFFVKGKLQSVGDDGSDVTLKEGDFCGDELLTWCLERDSEQPSGKRAGQRPVMGHNALSSRTVVCLGHVEAFSLDAADLEEVTKLYSRFLRNAKVQGAIRYASPYWRTRAAKTIQVAWRYRKKLSRSHSSMATH